MRLKLAKLAGGLRPAAVGIAFAALVVLLMLWLSGRFSAKISLAAAAPPGRAIPPGATVSAARLLRLPVTESAVGTIQAVHETVVASHILARVVEISLHAGQAVKAGQVLIRLSDSDLRARWQQAKAAADAASIQHDQAVVDEKRMASIFPNAASQDEYDRAVTKMKTTAADLTQANEAVAEAQAVLAYATIVSPLDGVVVDKKVDVGDTVVPGQPLVTIYDPRHMQLVADVRESLARRLEVGQEISVRLDVLDRTCTAQVSEIVPDAQSASRTFQVKVTGPCPPGLYTGMFGRIFIPLQDEQVLVIPLAAVQRVGQLELVLVAQGGGGQRRAVRTGRIIGADCEVLSGLRPGEKVILPAAAAASTHPAGEGIQP